MARGRPGPDRTWQAWKTGSTGRAGRGGLRSWPACSSYQARRCRLGLGYPPLSEFAVDELEKLPPRPPRRLGRQAPWRIRCSGKTPARAPREQRHLVVIEERAPALPDHCRSWPAPSERRLDLGRCTVYVLSERKERLGVSDRASLRRAIRDEWCAERRAVKRIWESPVTEFKIHTYTPPRKAYW